MQRDWQLHADVADPACDASGTAVLPTDLFGIRMTGVRQTAGNRNRPMSGFYRIRSSEGLGPALASALPWHVRALDLTPAPLWHWCIDFNGCTRL